MGRERSDRQKSQSRFKEMNSFFFSFFYILTSDINVYAHICQQTVTSLSQLKSLLFKVPEGNDSKAQNSPGNDQLWAEAGTEKTEPEVRLMINWIWFRHQEKNGFTDLVSGVVSVKTETRLDSIDVISQGKHCIQKAVVLLFEITKL